MAALCTKNLMKGHMSKKVDLPAQHSEGEANQCRPRTNEESIWEEFLKWS